MLQALPNAAHAQKGNKYIRKMALIDLSQTFSCKKYNIREVE